MSSSGPVCGREVCGKPLPLTSRSGRQMQAVRKALAGTETAQEASV